MLKTLIKTFKQKKAPNKKFDFFALSSAEKKKIMTKATRKANESQMKIVKEYEKRFGNI